MSTQRYDSIIVSLALNRKRFDNWIERLSNFPLVSMQNLSPASDEISFCKILTAIPFVKLQLIAHLICVNMAKHGSASVSVRERGWW